MIRVLKPCHGPLGKLAAMATLRSMDSAGQHEQSEIAQFALLESKERNKETEESAFAGMNMRGQKTHQRIVF